MLPLTDSQKSTSQTTSITCNYQRSHQFRRKGTSTATSLLPRQWPTTATPTLSQPRGLPPSNSTGSPQSAGSHPTQLGPRRRHPPIFSLDPTIQDPPRHTHQHDRLVTTQSHTLHNPEEGTHHGHTQTRKTRLLGTKGIPNDLSPANLVENNGTCCARQNDSFRTQLSLTTPIRLPERLFPPRCRTPNSGKSAQSIERQAIQLGSLLGCTGRL